MAHSPSGSVAAAASVGEEGATVDAATEDGGVESRITALLFDVSQQVQEVLQGMLKMTGEIEQCGGEIEAEIERAREAVADKGRALDDDRDRFQKAALAALNILSGGGAGDI
ncbi:hypothetical protein E2562_033356 [Oryza meyeriana var. granulata]|uniref:Uncharacterized protein n=1 Tax=Oryza meyeriana var. granulata TaxID=110450 RepID=A0A6G1E5Q7_9ORYZ|nr:hypothetical protein E2562_033356 [Oryza meyeriana var. granulata]KAF0920109.1 hypothetical protein E2562_033356 [Oryza meyeriana var. granulata]KAF0920110.1 hypothetical protein E2562_033356 [Oryza meyeriana var. granulata]